MSYDLRIWEQPTDRPPPATVEDAERAMLALEGKRPGVNPKFVALGKHMSARFPPATGDPARDDDPAWLSDPAIAAQSLDRAVWVVEIAG